MACKKCGSEWKTPLGKDCKSCPSCCKIQRNIAKQSGRWADPVVERACKICGSLFECIGLDEIRRNVVCRSESCRKEHRKQISKASRERRKAGLATPKKKGRGPRPCKREGCCNEVTVSSQDYCSRPCAGADARECKRSFHGKPVEIRQALCMANWFHGWEAERPEWMECEACHKKIERQSSMQRVCSEACRYRLGMPLHEACVDCQTPIEADTRYVRRCEPCKRKRRNALKKQAGKTPRKRCKRHGVPCDSSVTSRAVFERDGYVCQLCWRRCLDKFTVVDDMPDPLSPTVDHIIAIALGIKGHTWDNVQCACWECNVAKGAAARGQLRLAIA